MKTPRLILPDDFLGRDSTPDIKLYVHQRVKAALGLGRTPWRIPVSYDPNCGLPHNVHTGGRYRGVNTILLCDTYKTKAYRSKWWGPKEDWAAVGGTVRAGEEPTIIVHYVGDADWSLEPRLVFNAAQVVGADKYQWTIKDHVVNHADADFGHMGQFMEFHTPRVLYDVGDENNPPDYIGYVPPYPWSKFPNHDTGDYIMMQSIERCCTKACHFSILLHEFVHWAEVRTGWMHCLPVREFVAEMGMHVLGLELGVPYTLDTHNRYKWQGHWNRIATKDGRFFLWATAQVDRVVDHLLKPIFHRDRSFYHDPWCVVPKVNRWPGEDGMRFEVVKPSSRMWPDPPL